MAYPALVDIVLIASISGLIAICVYSLQLEDKLLSRIEKLEGKVSITHDENKSASANIPRLPSVNPAAPSENLYAPVKESDRMNPTREPFSNTLTSLTKFEEIGNNGIDRQESTIFNREKISQSHKRTDPLDEDSFEWPQDQF